MEISRLLALKIKNISKDEENTFVNSYLPNETNEWSFLMKHCNNKKHINIFYPLLLSFSNVEVWYRKYKFSGFYKAILVS